MIDQYVNKIIQGNALDLVKELPNESIDMCITSPPYWGLRDYGDTVSAIWGGDKDCEHEWSIDKVVSENNKLGLSNNKCDDTCIKCSAWRGQLGLEPHPNMYIEHLISIFEAIRPKLKKEGSLYINMGDMYYGTIGWTDKNQWHFDKPRQKTKTKSAWLQPKQLMMMPARFCIAMQDKGWILRNQIIWYKSNCMPSSVRDRLNNTYEIVYHFVKNRKYWYDLNAIREKYKPATFERSRYSHSAYGESGVKLTGANKAGKKSDVMVKLNEYGKNPGDVWTINTEPYLEAHFATFPQELLKKPILSSCPEWICKKCGKARVRIIEPSEEYAKKLGKSFHDHKDDMGKGLSQKKTLSIRSEYKTIGWTDCGCNAGWRPGIVLDPFIGSGTTGLVALRANRSFIGFELNPEYIKLAEKRLKLLLNQLKLEF